eukprot:10397463-Lingulodinium_polyedra.AAC.1
MSGQCLANDWLMIGQRLAEWPMKGHIMANERPARGQYMSNAWPVNGKAKANSRPMQGQRMVNSWPAHGQWLAHTWI